MTLADLVDVAAWVEKAGVYGLLITALFGGYFGLYVWRWQYLAVVQEKDEWKRVALRGLNLAEQVVPK